MSIKRIIVGYSPTPVIKLAKAIRHLGRSASARMLRYKLQNGSSPIRLELGSGSKKGTDGWTTLDLVPGCDMYCDLANGIPFPSNSVKDIYSSHLFEHLTFKQAQAFLHECLRVMVPGGKFSICVPNARLYLEAYLNGQLLDDQRFLNYKPAYNRTTGIDYVNYIAYMDGQHKYMFDRENLVYVLQQGGFKNVRIREFDKTVDMERRDCYSIYAEGYK
jgi:predicted SAM-dependent methyltransferase